MKLKPPKPDQFELSVFGPGYGEAALVHLGEGEWLVADSCVDQRSKAHPVLRYLKRIGVEASTQVKRIVVSHWHRDHVRGLARMVEACPSALIFLSDAMKLDELMAMTMNGATVLSVQSPLRELHDSVQVLNSRSPKSAIPRPLRVASVGMNVYRRKGKVPCSVEAVAPSYSDVLGTKMELAGLVKSDAFWRPATRHPNDTSVALWIEFGDIRVLLGADLESRSDDSRGWGSVVAYHSANLQGLATMVKVPHHGSITGHDDRMWSAMVDDQSHAMLAPYRPSKIPRESDLDRIQRLADRVHLTAEVEPIKPPSVPELSGHARSIEEPEGRSGQVRIRGDAADGPDAFEVSWNSPAREVKV